MKFVGFIPGFVCLLLASGMVGCGPSPQALNSPSQSSGGLVEKLSIEELAARADAILVGKVTNITCYQKGKGNIYTQVTLSIEQTIKGETQGEAVITIPGGELNGQKLMVEDTPNFQLGERAVVFLEERDGIFSVVGGFQGKFTIDKNNMVSGNTPLTEFIDQIRDTLAKQ